MYIGMLSTQSTPLHKETCTSFHFHPHFMGKCKLHGKLSRWHLSPHAHWYHWYHVNLYFLKISSFKVYSHEIYLSTHTPTLYTWESKFAHIWVFRPSTTFLHPRSFIKSFPRPTQNHQTEIVEDERIVIAQHLDQLINQAGWQQVVHCSMRGEWIN